MSERRSKENERASERRQRQTRAEQKRRNTQSRMLCFRRETAPHCLSLRVQGFRDIATDALGGECDGVKGRTHLAARGRGRA